MIKVKNNANKVIEVTKIAWETLYKNREGFSLHEEKKRTKKSTTKTTTTKKKATTKKSPTKKAGDE